MTDSTALLDRLAAHGFSTRIDSGGGLRIHPADKLTDDLRHSIRENKAAILGSLWESRNALLLAQLPQISSGPCMNCESYQALRSYIASSNPARLMDYRGRIGCVISVTPPNAWSPAGTVALLLENGNVADYDARAVRYLEGAPVANTCWVEVEYDPDAGGVEF